MTRRLLLLVCAGVLTLASAVPSVRAQDAHADALAPLRRALANRQWVAAEQLATQAINAGGGDAGDAVDLLLLRAVARKHAGTREAALTDLRAVQAHAQAGRRASKATFRTAALLAEMGRAEEALKLTEAAVAGLRAGERRDAIAQIYLDVVDSLVRPKAGEGVVVGTKPPEPQWRDVYPLLLKAEELELQGVTAAAIQLDLLRCEIETEPRGADPAKRARAFVATHPEHADLAEVRFLLGSALVKARHFEKAREAFLAVVEHHGDGVWAPQALDASAAALLAVGAAHHEALAAAIADTEQLFAAYGDHALSPPALMRLAGTFSSDPALFDRALATFERVAQRWPAHALAGQARLVQAELLADRGRGDEAIALLQAFVQGRVVDAAWQAAVLQIAEVRHTLASRHYQAGSEKWPEELPGRATRDAAQAQHRDKARAYWQTLMDATPTDARVPFILFSMAEMELRDARTIEAIAAWEKLATRFPTSDEAGRARYAIGEAYAETLKDFPKAVAAFEAVPAGKWGELAAQRVRGLKAESLSLSAKRIFHSGDRLEVELTTRNIDSLEMAAYRIDLKEHFLQTGHLDGLVQLDVALIKPDHTWTVRIEAGQPLASRTQMVALVPNVPAAPEGRPAAWVITARAKLLEARTAVLVNDLEALTALSKARSWSHIVDRRTGAQVDGSSVQRAVDGVLLPAGPSLPSDAAQGTMSVLVERGGHAAIADLDAKQLPVAPTPEAAAWLWSDRSRYQRGDTIQLFGVVRDLDLTDADGAAAEGAQLVVPPSGAYRCRLYDTSANVELANAVVQLNAEGAFHLAIPIPATMLGSRRCELRLSKKAGATDTLLRSIGLRVEPIASPAIVVTLDQPAAPVPPGAAVAARLRITDGHGEPIAHELATIAIAGTDDLTRTTTAQGFVDVPVPAAVTLDGAVVITVELRGQRAWARVPLLSQRLTVTATGGLTERIPAVAGEEFMIPFEARRGESPASGLALRASVWRPDVLTKLKQVGEEVSLTTGDDGTVGWSVRPVEAGAHLIRVEYTDRHGLPVRREWPLHAAGAGDPARVRLIPAALAYPAGATVPLRLASDLPAQWAWVMVHGDRLWSAKRIALTAGMTRVDVTLPPAPHRSARVTCLIEAGGTLYAPSLEFTVNHALAVTIEAPAGPQRPGATAQLRVRVAGPDGRPVAGHVAVMVMEEADAESAGGRVASLTERFLPATSETFVRFGLSAAYRPPATVEARDAAIEHALAELTAAANRAHAPVMVEQVPLDDMVERRALPGALRGKFWNDDVGVGGGAGGAFGGRFGGKRDLVARGGGGRATERSGRVPQPPLLVRGALRAGADGVATLDVPLPLRRGKYVCFAVAVSGPTLFGNAEATIEVGGDLDAEVLVPRELRAGDTSAVRVRLHNRRATARTVALTVVRISDGAVEPVRASVELAAGAATEQLVALPDLGLGHHTIRVAVDPADGGAPIVAERTVTVFGGELAGASGTASAGVDASIDGAGPLAVRVDASAAAVLMAIAEQPASLSTDRIAVASALWTAAEALIAVPKDPNGTWPAAARSRTTALQRVATQRLYALLALRSKSGRRGDTDWRNCAEVPNRAMDPESLGLTLVALARAKAAGLAVPEERLSDALSALDGHFTDAADDDDKAWILFCRSFHEAPTYAWVNRLYRSRAQLGVRAKALLAHLLATAQRTAEAKTVLAELEAAAGGAAGGRFWDAVVDRGRLGEDRETITAAVLAAAHAAGHSSAVITEAQSWFAAQRAGVDWRGPFSAAVALSAIARSAAAASVPVPASVSVSVPVSGGDEVTVLALGNGWASGTVSIPAAKLAEGAVRVRVTPAGAGSIWWSAVRSAPGARSANSPTGMAVKRENARVAGRVDGLWVGAGRSIESGWRSDAQVPVATRLVPGWETHREVTVTWGDAPVGVYWVFEPLPAGAGLVDGSIDEVEQVRRTQGGLWLRVTRDSTREFGASFSYRLRGEWPGRYGLGGVLVARAPRTAAWGFDVPDQAALDVAAAGSDPGEGSPVSLDERFGAGRAALARKDYAKAREYLLPLADRKLRTSPFQTVTRDLLEACVGAGAGDDVVRFFEVLRERDPNFVITFARMVDVGQAYAAMGEHERGRQIYVAVADALFLQEAGAVGALEQQGHTRAAFGAAERLLTEYGDSDVVRGTMFAYAQRAFFVGRGAPVTRAIAGDGYTRDDLFGIATGALDRYLADFSSEPAADEVSLTLATAHMEAGAFDAARVTASDSAARHADSTFLDTFDYIQAAAAFALRDFDAALRLCDRLITHDYGSRANPGPALTAALGHHMTAQIHHARGDLEKAVESYRKVENRFTDAARALRFLQREGLRMADLTVVRGAEPVTIEVEHRGGETLVVQVYPVDLRMLLMTHRDSAGLAAVNLAGVKPALITSQAGSAASKGVQRVPLALPKVGAYLVVVRAGALRTRGLVVRSDLALEVQEAGGDAARVNVVSVATGAYIARAAVTFIGSGGGGIVSRQTDLRGICEAGGLKGLVNVVAEHQGHYALHYGTTNYGRPSPQRRGAQAESPNEEFDQSDEPMSQLEDRLADIRGRNEQAWKSNTTKQQKGVEAGRAKK